MTHRFRSIIVHIGLGKTGSSSIQRVLLRHAQELESAHGILFPIIRDDPRPFAGNHSLVLRSLCSSEPQSLRFNIAAGLNTEAAASAADQQAYAQLMDSFTATPAHTLLLSAEGVGHFDEYALERLAAWLLPLGEQVRLLAWVRHPQHALAAEIQQRLQTGSVLARLYERPPFYRYSVLLARLERAFGKPAIELYDYADSISPGNSAVSTFLNKVGVELSLSEQDEVRVNTALSQQATLMLDAANRLRPLVIDGKRNPLRRPHDMMKILQVQGQPYSPPMAVYEKLAELARPELDWLSHTYGFMPKAVPPRYPPGSDDVVDHAAIEAEALRLLDSVS